MMDQAAKGIDFETRAEKKLSSWVLFGSKNDDAAELFEKAANCFKLAKEWKRAASVYIKLAKCHIKLDSKYDAASAYASAANCFKKCSDPAMVNTSRTDAAEALNEAINLYLESGRLNLAARYCKELGELYEADQDLEKAINYFERAADLFESEESTSSANQCKQSVAQIAAQLEMYPKAVDIYERVARKSMNNNLLKYSGRGILLNAGLCQLCRGDFVIITKALERYQEIDPTFTSTREYKFLADLAKSIDEQDVEKFKYVIQEYDSMTRLDDWKAMLLLRVKNALEIQAAADDLT